MKNIIAIIACLVGFIGCNAQTKFQSMNTDEFEKIITKANVICLDVRTKPEYEEGHIANSTLIDIRNPEFEQLALQTLPKDKTIAVYCRSGKRSKVAADILSKNGYTVVELNTGILGWTQAGKPLTKE